MSSDNIWFIAPNGQLFIDFSVGIYPVYGASAKKTKGEALIGRRTAHDDFPPKWCLR